VYPTWQSTDVANHSNAPGGRAVVELSVDADCQPIFASSFLLSAIAWSRQTVRVQSLDRLCHRMFAVCICSGIPLRRDGAGRGSRSGNAGDANKRAGTRRGIASPARADQSALLVQ